MLEVWKKWTPVENLSSQYKLVSIIEEPERVQIILVGRQDDTKKVCVNFFTRVFSYRVRNLQYKKKPLENSCKSILEDSSQEWTFFTVDNSKYKQYLIDKDIFPAHNFMQFSFITKEAIIDVVASKEPVVEMH